MKFKSFKNRVKKEALKENHIIQYTKSPDSSWGQNYAGAYLESLNCTHHIFYKESYKGKKLKDILAHELCHVYFIIKKIGDIKKPIQELSQEKNICQPTIDYIEDYIEDPISNLIHHHFLIKELSSLKISNKHFKKILKKYLKPLIEANQKETEYQIIADEKIEEKKPKQLN